MRCSVVSRNYCVELTLLQMGRLLKRDERAAERGDGALCDLLDALEGVSRVEYDGHLGPRVFFTYEDGPNRDTADVVAAIKEYVDGK